MRWGGAAVAAGFAAFALRGAKVLLPRADIATATLSSMLDIPGFVMAIFSQKLVGHLQESCGGTCVVRISKF